MTSDDQLCVLELGRRALRVDDRTRRAVEALGWEGAVVPEIRLLGQRVSVVAAVDHDAHQERLRAGNGPVIDRMSVALWEWPDMQAPAPVVRLIGILAEGSRWQRVMGASGGFIGFCSTAIVLRQRHAPNPHCLLTAQLHGVAVVRSSDDGDVELVQQGRTGPTPAARPTTVSRWLEEIVYARLLQDGQLTIGSAA